MNPPSTKRISFRRLNANDLKNMVSLETDPDVVRFTPAQVPLSPEKIKSRLDAYIEQESAYGDLGVWATELTESKEFVGWFMLLKKEENIELGFMILAKFWGKGFASEVSKALVDYARKIYGDHKIIARTAPENFASTRVLEKVGFRLSGQEPWQNRFLNLYTLSPSTKAP